MQVFLQIFPSKTPLIYNAFSLFNPIATYYHREENILLSREEYFIPAKKIVYPRDSNNFSSGE